LYRQCFALPVIPSFEQVKIKVIGNNGESSKMGVSYLQITTTLDQNDGTADNGLSLREALMIANNDTANEYVIELQSGGNYFLPLIRRRCLLIISHC
jgi:hypothetical protein